MKKEINIGLVGCGMISKKHIQAIRDTKNTKLYAVCDIIKDRADNIANTESCKVFHDFNEMLKDEKIDVVSVCTPNGLHSEMSIQAMKAGKHVLCEKPMTLNLIDAAAVVKTVNETKKSFFLVKQNRFNPPIMALKEAFKNNKLGIVFLINATVYWNRNDEYYSSVDWRGTLKTDGGALLTQSSHFLDLMIWIGGKVKSVISVMKNVAHPAIETEDLGVVILKFENGCIGTLQYTTNVYEKNFEGTMGVLGTKGTVKIGGKYLNELEFWNVEDMPKPILEDSSPANDYGTYQGSMSNHDKVYKNIVANFLGIEEITTPAIQGQESIEVIQAAHIAAIENREVFLPLKGKDYDFKINKQESKPHASW